MFARMDGLERIDRQTAAAETRRARVLTELERRQETLARRLRKLANAIDITPNERPPRLMSSAQQATANRRQCATQHRPPDGRGQAPVAGECHQARPVDPILGPPSVFQGGDAARDGHRGKGERSGRAFSPRPSPSPRPKSTSGAPARRASRSRRGWRLIRSAVLPWARTSKRPCGGNWRRWTAAERRRRSGRKAAISKNSMQPAISRWRPGLTTTRIGHPPGFGNEANHGDDGKGTLVTLNDGGDADAMRSSLKAVAHATRRQCWQA